MLKSLIGSEVRCVDADEGSVPEVPEVAVESVEAALLSDDVVPL